VPRFEVLVPASPPAVPADVTLQVEAEHWLAALKGGLARLGGAQPPSNVLCDVRADGSIHVTDAEGGGVFRIRELHPVPAVTGATAPPPGRAAAPPPPAPRPAAGPVRAPPAAPPAPPARIGRPPRAASAEDVLAELFERVSDLEDQRDRASGLAFLLDLAMEKIGCEAGSVFLARLGGRALEFAVARGPRSQEILKLGLTVPMGVGIAGFCAQENVCLAVSDAEKDPRFHRAVSQAIGYETRSLLCAPIARGGLVLGALEVLNKKGGRPFEPTDLAVLSYLAHQAAALIGRLDG
jgi:hypothetical protein